MKSNNRRQIWIKLGTMSVYDLDGDVDTIIKELRELQERYKDEYDYVSLDWDKYGEPYDDSGVFVINGYRMETDEERDKRVDVKVKSDAKWEKGERAELARLKEKYEEQYPY